MADGYGFGAEGDWKTAALVRIVKVMSDGLRRRHLVHGGLHLPPRRRRRAASSARTCSRSARRSPRRRPSCEIHPLSIGGREDPVRLVFTAAPGPAVVVGMLDLGDRFRLVANEIDARRTRRGPPEAARGACGVGAGARLHHVRRGLAVRRWPAPHASSAGRSASRRSTTSRRSSASSWSSSTRRPRSATSPTSCAGTRPTTGSPAACRGAARRAARTCPRGEHGPRPRRARRPHLRERERRRPRRERGRDQAERRVLRQAHLRRDRGCRPRERRGGGRRDAALVRHAHPPGPLPRLARRRRHRSHDSSFATAWAQAGTEIPCYGTTHADHFDGPVPVTRSLTTTEIEGATSRRRAT